MPAPVVFVVQTVLEPVAPLSPPTVYPPDNPLEMVLALIVTFGRCVLAPVEGQHHKKGRLLGRYIRIRGG